MGELLICVASVPLQGFTGPVCQIDIDDCSSTPCLNGAKCIDHPNGYECQCATGKLQPTLHRWGGPLPADDCLPLAAHCHSTSSRELLLLFRYPPRCHCHSGSVHMCGWYLCVCGKLLVASLTPQEKENSRRMLPLTEALCRALVSRALQFRGLCF